MLDFLKLVCRCRLRLIYDDQYYQRQLDKTLTNLKQTTVPKETVRFKKSFFDGLMTEKLMKLSANVNLQNLKTDRFNTSVKLDN